MSTPRSEVETRIDVTSPDGTPLAVWVAGDGPPLVMVHGSLVDHSIFESLAGALRDAVTVHAMDRRGFGVSGDAAAYAIEREFEDVAAVVDAVAERTGGPVALWGHSFGANCAMGGAALSRHVHHLVLYEPSLGLTYPAGSIEAIEEAVLAGDVDAAVVAVLTEILELPAEDVSELRAGPRWPSFLAAGPTVPRECRVEDGWVYRPGQFDDITARTLMLAGSESPPAVREATQRARAAIPDARVLVLEGHAHLAFQTDPGMVAAIIRDVVLA